MSEPYEWEEAQWRGMVEQVRAGRSLLPERWPGGARCAVALSFDSDHETNELRDGGTSIARLGWGEYGTRRGIPRIKKVLDRFDVKASFFVPAVAALLHPEEQRMLAQEGHEIACTAGSTSATRWSRRMPNAISCCALPTRSSRSPARAGGDAHAFVGLLRRDAEDRARDGAAL